MVLSIPDFVDYMIVVGDVCPDLSEKKAEKTDRRNLVVIYRERSHDMGGALVSPGESSKMSTNEGICR